MDHRVGVSSLLVVLFSRFSLRTLPFILLFMIILFFTVWVIFCIFFFLDSDSYFFFFFFHFHFFSSLFTFLHFDFVLMFPWAIFCFAVLMAGFLSFSHGHRGLSGWWVRLLVTIMTW